MIGVLGLHLLLAVILPGIGRRWGRRAYLVAAIGPLAALILVGIQAPEVLAGSPIVARHSWVPGMGLGFNLTLDGIALLMVVVVSFIGVLVLIYSYGYMSDDGLAGRLSSLLVAFAGSMLGLVMAEDLFTMFVFWELTSVTSYMLIGLEDHRAEARSAALQALLVTGLGGLVMLGGIVLLSHQAGTTSLSGILSEPPSGVGTSVAAALILVGAFTKSAQVPFHFWLPGAMAAPTPISAYLHSATMVKAGVFLIARLAPAFAMTVGFWRPVVVGIGLATMIVGGYRALQQNDMKLLLAYGTVSQLGFMVALLGAGVAQLATAGVALLIAHTLFKATLFLITGIVDHEFHTRDIRRLDYGARRLPAVAVAAVIGASSMAGAPLLFGFVAKEEALAALLNPEVGMAAWALVGVVFGSVLTVCYSFRFVIGAFYSSGDISDDQVDTPSSPSWALSFPILMLTAMTVFLGLFPGYLDSVVLSATSSLHGVVQPIHLEPWHGFNTALGLSVFAVLGGWTLWRFPLFVVLISRRTANLPNATRLYQRSLVGLNWLANKVTGISQTGSLPIYIGVILLTALALSSPHLVGAWAVPDDLIWALNPAQAGVGALVILAAIGTTRVQERLAAILWLGTVGYGVAVLMVIQGAPDVALTQVLVETMLVVIFVLVLRHLPLKFERVRWRARQATRVAISVGIGVFASLFALLVSVPQPSRTVSSEMIALALPEAGGRNVVNVILTDFRALDTLGEIIVVATAAMGVMTLVRPRAALPEEEQ